MDIRIYTFAFDFVCIIHKYISSNWTIQYNGIGTWECHMPLDGTAAQIMQYPYLVAIQGDNQAIITGRQANTEFVLYGRTVNWILSRRVIQNFKTSELGIPQNGADIARWVVSQVFFDVDNFTVDNTLKLTTSEPFWRNTYNYADEVVADALSRDGAGHRVEFDTAVNVWRFVPFIGNDSGLVVSEDTKNAYQTEYTEDGLNEYNGCYYEVQLEEDATQAGDNTEDGDAPATEWREIPSTKTGIYRFIAIASAQNESEAKSDLAKRKRTRDVTAKARRLSYGNDYSLGDIVTLKKSAGTWKHTTKARITGVNLAYEHGGYTEQPIFEEVEEE